MSKEQKVEKVDKPEDKSEHNECFIKVNEKVYERQESFLYRPTQSDKNEKEENIIIASNVEGNSGEQKGEYIDKPNEKETKVKVTFNENFPEAENPKPTAGSKVRKNKV